MAQTREDTQELLQARVPAALMQRVRMLVAGRGKGVYPRDVIVEALEDFLPKAELRMQESIDSSPAEVARSA